MDNFEMTSTRPRSPRRLRHEAQIKIFERETGDLEKIRTSLGLRPSQICEILKVHPSAWTRWVRSGKAPPHVYQMLEWYIELLGWRGQHNPIPQGPRPHWLTSPKASEDLQIYVPEGESRRFQRYPRPLLMSLWAVQMTLWAVLVLILWKGR